MPFGLPSNFPTKPTTIAPTLLTYPRDLIAPGRNFYTHIDFKEYSAIQTFQSVASPSQSDTSIILPIPKKINEIQTVVWKQESLLSLGATASSIMNVIGPTFGYAINPMLWMLFQSPEFKEHTLSWTVVANNEQESNDIAKIIHEIKKHMSPALAFGGIAYSYPSVAHIKFHPNDDFTFKFKPAVVLSVNVDYGGAGMPSFFKNGAPTVVNISMLLKEIGLWTKQDY